MPRDTTAVPTVAFLVFPGDVPATVFNDDTPIL